MVYSVVTTNQIDQYIQKRKVCVQRATSNDKNKKIKNLIFTNLRWHFGSKKVKGKHTNRITGEVKTKTICMSIQKLVKPPIITHNNYGGVETDELVEIW